jgi:hypothetical protein
VRSKSAWSSGASPSSKSWRRKDGGEQLLTAGDVFHAKPSRRQLAMLQKIMSLAWLQAEHRANSGGADNDVI